jgi:hypothetical protein
MQAWQNRKPNRVLKNGTGTSWQTKTLDEIERSLGAGPFFQQAAKCERRVPRANESPL